VCDDETLCTSSPGVTETQLILNTQQATRLRYVFKLAQFHPPLNFSSCSQLLKFRYSLIGPKVKILKMLSPLAASERCFPCRNPYEPRVRFVLVLHNVQVRLTRYPPQQD